MKDAVWDDGCSELPRRQVNGTSDTVVCKHPSIHQRAIMSRALQQLLNPVNGENEPTVDGSFVPNGSMNNVAINHTDFLGSGNNCGGEFLK